MTSIIVDAHLDIAYNVLAADRDFQLPVEEIRRQERAADKHRGTCMVSLPAMLEGHIAVAGGSIFVSPPKKLQRHNPSAYQEVHEHAVAQLDYYRRLADEDERVILLQTFADLEQVLQAWETGEKCLGLLIVMEGADPIREPAELEWWVERGLRGVGLAWWSGSHYAGGNANRGPITDEGYSLLDAMAAYNLPLDLSHLWIDAAYEALDRYPGPIVGTHSTPAAFVDTPRSFSDDLIRRMADRGGVMGVMPVNAMLDPQWHRDDPRLPLDRFVQAIDHVCQVVGHAACVGIGSDLDGGFGRESVPIGLESIADLGKIEALLLERGYRETDVRAILSENWLRVMQGCLAGF